jgi:Asp-tRNA(Asn)/Glu-tRNA(Gln) amidotransferase A subunit family amidase
VRAGRRHAAELLRSLGHEVREIDPPWQVDGLAELFGAVFSNHIALSIAYSGMVAGREPTAADMEPMSWAIFSIIKKMSAIIGRPAGEGPLLALAAQLEAAVPWALRRCPAPRPSAAA